MTTLPKSDISCQFAVIGAGPYGLAVASHLRGAGFKARVFGKPMEFWEQQMPAGMRLRSPLEGTHIADPRQSFTLDQYESAHATRLSEPLPVEEFIRYGQWFQRESLPDLDQRYVVRVERSKGGFKLDVEDGESLWTKGVVVAAGIAAFPRFPAPFQSLAAEFVSHTSERINHDLGRFRGRQVVVIGAGQSAIESAALMHEAGAQVRVFVRQPRVRWLRYGTPLHNWLHSEANPFRKILYSPGNLGLPGINWLIETPRLFRLIPHNLQDWLSKVSIGPAASGWLKPRTQAVTISTGRSVVSATARGKRVHMRLDDGSETNADHVLLGTGYKIDISRYRFLAPELLQTIRTVNGFPVLKAGFESSLPGLYFVGAPAAYSFGPICRFVAGTPFVARHLARAAAKKRDSRKIRAV